MSGKCEFCNAGFGRYRPAYQTDFIHEMPDGRTELCEDPPLWRTPAAKLPGMSGLLADVRAFHEACDVPVATRPAWPGSKRAELREKLQREEFIELCDAFEAHDLVGVADALADIIYIAVGTAIECGIPLDRVWDEVQRSNMAKIDPATGKALKRADGKVIKPLGWKGPDVAGAIFG